MSHHLCFQSILILVLFSFHCYSSPIPFNEQTDEQQQTLLPINMNEQEKKNSYLEMMEPFGTNKNDQFHSSNILCALYGDCYYDDQQSSPNTNTKRKRLPSNLFHGIPKFGKRAFTSAFSGIPKFG